MKSTGPTLFNHVCLKLVNLKLIGIHLFLIKITMQSQHINHTSISRWAGIVCLFVYAIQCALDFFNPYHIRSSIVSFINVIVNTPLDKTWPSRKLYQSGHFRYDMRQHNCGTGGDHCRQKLLPCTLVHRLWAWVATPETANNNHHLIIMIQTSLPYFDFWTNIHIWYIPRNMHTIHSFFALWHGIVMADLTSVWNKYGKIIYQGKRVASPTTEICFSNRERCQPKTSFLWFGLIITHTRSYPHFPDYFICTGSIIWQLLCLYSPKDTFLRA